MKYQVIFAIVAFLASALAVAVFADELPMTEQVKERCQKAQSAQADDAAANCQCPKCPYANDAQKPCNGCKDMSAEKRKNCPKAQAAAAESAAAPSVFDAAQPVGTPATCPVLSNAFTIAKSTPHSEAGGKHVYFCCTGCKQKFDADPDKYLKTE